MIQLKDVLVDGSDYRISLTKLLGERKIKDIVGMITKPFSNDPLFELLDLVLDDGTKISIAGEHDCPYLEGDFCYSDKLTDEVLDSLYKESNGEDEEE